jgi:hypothetical protein
MSPDRARLTIDFELDSEPIAGSLQDADGRTTAFNGWIQLVSLLQAAATTRLTQADPASNGNPGSRQPRR